MMIRHILGLVALGLLVSPGLAAMMFTETFDDGTVGSNLINQGGNQVIGGRVYTAAAVTAERNYIVTNDSDYATTSQDWTYTLDVDNTGTPENWVRVGIGSGLPAAGTWGDNGMWFYEPANALYLSIDTHSSMVSVFSAGANGFPTTVQDLKWGGNQTGTARIKKVGGDLVFGWDEGSTGTFAECTVAISSYPMLSTSSKLFCSVFEGNTTSSVDNFSVTPEPATMGMLGIGGLLTLIRRKRA